MRRLQALAKRLVLAGLAALSLGVVMVLASLVHNAGTPAFAGSSPYELYCPGTPVGNIALNDVTTTGSITPAAPAVGDQFNLTGFQTTVALPSSIAAAAAALGNSAIAGSAALKVDATGATPAAVAAPPISIDAPIPSPVPAAGLVLTLPSTPATVGPFTASGGTITLTVDPAVSLVLVVSGSNLSLTCTPYPNNSATTGIVSVAPTTAKASPVIAVATPGSTTSTTIESSTSTTAGNTTTTTAPTAPLTGAYELYCPGTPVGTVVLNDAVTSASLSPPAPISGQPFSVTGYQTTVNLPSALAGAAAAVGGPNLTGSATTQIDASGATPAALAQGPLDFNVPIPSPVPDAGVTLSLPSTPATIGGFTATSGPITIEQDSSASLSLTVAGNALVLTCTAYPNDSVTPSGIATTIPTANPIAPVIASAAGSSSTTTTTAGPTTTTSAPSTTTTSSSGITTTTTAVTTGTSSPTSTSTPSATSSTQGSSGSTTSTPPKPTTSTVPATKSASSTSSTARAVTASSRSLAFTGPGPGLKTMTLIGAVVILFGLLMLLLADFPRRVINQLTYASPRHRKIRTTGGTRVTGKTTNQDAFPEARESCQTLFRRTETLRVHEDLFFSPGGITALVGDGPVKSHGPTARGTSHPDVDEPNSPISTGEQSSPHADATDEAGYPPPYEANATLPWWLASDGVWYPPQQHPDFTGALEPSRPALALEVASDTANPSPGSPPAGWYENPLGNGLRYWDGASWTEEFAFRRYVTALDEPPPGQAQRLELPGWWLTSGDI